MSTIKISDLATSSISLTDFIVKAGATGIATKNTVQGISDVINANNTLFKETIAIADIPSENGWYFASEIGTYTNCGGLVIDTSDNIAIIVISGTFDVFNKIDIPLNITIDASAIDGSSNAISSDAVFDIKTALQIKDNSLIEKKIGLNVLDISKLEYGKGVFSSGNIGTSLSSTSYAITEKIYFNGNTEIICNCCATGGFYAGVYDNSDVKVVTVSQQTRTQIVDVSSYPEASYVLFTIFVPVKPKMIQFGSVLSDFEQYDPFYGYTQDVNLYAYPTGGTDTDTDFYYINGGLSSIQKAIDSCNTNHNYIIHVKGEHIFTTASDFTLADNGYYYMTYIKSGLKNITLQGDGMDATVMNASLPDNLGTSFDYDKYITLEILGDNCIVNDMTVIAKNMRYAVHTDESAYATADNNYLEFNNLRFWHKGNTNDALAVWTGQSGYGLGISSGMHIVRNNCESISANGSSIYLHDNKGFKRPFYYKIKGEKLRQNTSASTTGASAAMTIQLLGSNNHGMIEFENIDFGSDNATILAQNSNANLTDLTTYQANIRCRIVGNVDAKIFYLQDHSISKGGSCLRVVSNTVGASSSVRFTNPNTMFNVLIAGIRSVSFEEENGIVHEDNYQYRDGSDVLSGFAMGELALDVSTHASMQSRIGDRSVSAQYFRIIIDGVSHSVLLNQDYTSYSDSAMLAVINNAISGYGVASLHYWGDDYHPEFNNCLTRRKNNSNYTILKGMGVNIQPNGLSPAETNSQVKGIAIEDIPIGKIGRVMKKGILSTLFQYNYYILMNDVADQKNYSIGALLGISANRGLFEEEAGTGIIRVDNYFQANIDF
jgi:hypothetical protein